MKWIVVLKSMHIHVLSKMFSLKLLMGRKGPFSIHEFTQVKILDSSWIFKSQIYLCTLNDQYMSLICPSWQ